MKNHILLLALLLFSTGLIAQSKYVIKESNVRFFSEAPMENIEATNADTKAVVDSETGEFSFRVPIKSFVFDKSLMRDHFNENYMESDKYPNGTFKGKIEGDFSMTDDGVYALEAVGTLSIHGVEKEMRIPATITVQGEDVSIDSKFIVKLVDHKIQIPKIVFYNIAEEIEVTISASLVAYQK